MRPAAADGHQDQLEQDAPEHEATDPAIRAWFLGDGERVNRASDLRGFTPGNRVVPLVDGREYFARLCAELVATACGDQVYFLDFRGDLDERLDGVGTEVGELLSGAARRGVGVFGMLWRSQTKLLHQSEEANAQFARVIDHNGGHLCLEARTRRGGSHHQKLVVVRHPGSPARDVAFVGGIDLSHSRSAGVHFPAGLRAAAALARHSGGGAGPGGARPRAHPPGAVVRQQSAGPARPGP